MNTKYNSGLIIGGFTLIGMGVGYLTHAMKACMFIGIGIGLLVSFYLRSTSKKNTNGNEG